jgi:hypothetical protein
LKLAVFTGDQYVLQQFGREDSGYAVSAEKTIANKTQDILNITNALGRNKKKDKLDFNKLQAIAKQATGFHTASISDNGKYISFRHAGGNYLADYATIANTVGRFIRAMLIASDPNAYAQEYKTKIAKLMTPQTTGVSNDLAMSLRQRGLPAFTISLWLKGRTTAANAVKHLLEPLQLKPVEYSIHSSQPNSAQAKQMIVHTMRNETRKAEAERAMSDKFVTVVVAPKDPTAIQHMQQYQERGVSAVDNGWSILGYGLVKKSTIPAADPMSKAMVRSLVGMGGATGQTKPIPFPKDPRKQ